MHTMNKDIHEFLQNPQTPKVGYILCPNEVLEETWAHYRDRYESIGGVPDDDEMAIKFPKLDWKHIAFRSVDAKARLARSGRGKIIRESKVDTQ